LELLFKALVGFSKKRRRHEIQRAIQSGEFVVACLPGESNYSRSQRLAGFIHGIVHNDPISAGPLLYVTALFVERSFRRQGIGSALLDFIIRRSVHQRSIEGVEVATALRDALRFYERLGFSQFKAEIGEVLVQIEPDIFRTKNIQRPKFKGMIHNQESRA
jgi:ribosomal protein S18 acetylase RimI-like enzyme